MTSAEHTISVQDGDQKLTFAIRKMRPVQLEQWLARALALMVQNPEAGEKEYLAAGKKLAAEGYWALMRAADPEAATALTDQMLTCCSRLVENVEQHCTPESLNGFVREVSTLVTLKNEALKLNLAFLLREGETFGA